MRYQELTHLLLLSRLSEGKIPLVDYHIHLFDEGRCLSLRDTVEKVLIRATVKGVVCFYDMGSKDGIGLELKRHFSGIVTAGSALYKRGGYGSFLGVPIETPKDIVLAVRDNIQKGADFIKVINSGIVTTDPKLPITVGGFTLEELRIIVEESTSKGKKVYCHANGLKSIRDALLAGVASLEHGIFIDEECLHIMKERSVSWTPTAYALSSLALRTKDREQLRYLHSMIDKHLQAISRANELGVSIKAGSDSGARGLHHGVAFFEELKLLAKAGLSEEALLQTCTVVDQNRGA